MQYTTLRDAIKPKPIPRKPPNPPKAPKTKRPKELKRQVKCPSGFYFDKDKGRCVQAGVGPRFKP